MLFNSYIFLLLFLPITIIGYYTLNHSHKYQYSKIFLLIMSLMFYAYFNIKYLPIILISILFNYSLNKIMNNDCDNVVIRKILLMGGILANIGVLFYFKYYDFFVDNINTIFNTNFNFNNLILPLGISFFTFQQISYLIDSYNQEVNNYNILEYSLFVTFFPQLIAGPIVMHNELIPQLKDNNKKHINYENLCKGIMAFTFGLAKKVLLADIFGKAVNYGYSNIEVLDTTNILIVILAYTMQVYFDFSGYSDMAIGIGLMFNIELPINFESPYKAFTVSEFWKRWHITLTRFFTRYVYIPLGGNRGTTIRTYINIFIVFFISGVWHGANWTFILWGCLHGIALIVNRALDKYIKKLHLAFSWIITFAFINLSWIYFRSPSIKIGNYIINKILEMDFGPVKYEISSCFELSEFMYILESLADINIYILSKYPYFCMSIYFVFAFIAILGMKNTQERLRDFKPTNMNAITVIILLVWCTMSFSSVSTFLYFNF